MPSGKTELQANIRIVLKNEQLTPECNISNFKIFSDVCPSVIISRFVDSPMININF